MADALPPPASYTTAGVNVGVLDWDGRLGSRARSLTSLAATAFVGAWLGFYLITLWPSIALEAFRATLYMHITTAVVIVPYLVSLVLRRRLPGGSLVDIPVVAALCVYLLATATSVNWRVSLENTLTILAAVSMFFIYSDRGLFRRRQVEAGVMLAAVAAAVWALRSVLNVYMDYLDLTRAVNGDLTFADYVPPTVPRVNDVGDHPNILAMALAMAVPFFLVAFARRGDAPLRALGLLGLPVVALALFFTLSRGAWAGALIGSACTAALFFAVLPVGRSFLTSIRDGVRSHLGMFIAVVLLATLIPLVGAGVVLASRWESRPEWLFRESASPRVELINTGLDVYRDYPLLGTGPDVFGLLYPEYSGKHPRYHYHVHNGYLQTVVDTGLPGVVIMLALGGTFGWMTLRRLGSASQQTQLTLVAAFGGVVAFGIHSLVDAPNQAKTALTMLAAVTAVAALAAGERDELASRARRIDLYGAASFVARAFVPIAMAGLLITWGRLDAGQYEYSNSLGNANGHRWAASAEQARRAVELDPNFAIYRFQYGSVLARDYLQRSRPESFNDAVVQLKKGIELEPRSAIGHVNLALLYAEAEQTAGARDHALLALRYANRDPAVAMAAGEAFEKAGWEDNAIRAYATALYYDGNLADSPFWGTTTFRQRNYAEIVGGSALIFNACALLNLSNHGAPPATFTREEVIEACRNVVTDNPHDLRSKVTLAEGIMKSGGPATESRALLDAVLHAQPDHGPALAALGSWYRNEGDTGTARDYWVRAGQLDETDALVLLGDSYPPDAVPHEVVEALRSRMDKATSEIQLPLTTILYYRRSFYRGAPIDILLPGQWQSAMPGRYARALDALERWTPV